MSFRNYFTTQMELVAHLTDTGVITDDEIRTVMENVDRAIYCPNEPYSDAVQNIGNMTTISAPHMHAFCLDMLKSNLYLGAKALDVGAGTGYLTACMIKMVGVTGEVVGIDNNPSVIQLAIENIKKDEPELYNKGKIKFIVHDAWQEGLNKGSFDAINVGAAVTELPIVLLNLLKPGGKMILPMINSNKTQTLRLYTRKINHDIEKKDLKGVIFTEVLKKNSSPASTCLTRSNSLPSSSFHHQPTSTTDFVGSSLNRQNSVPSSSKRRLIRKRTAAVSQSRNQ